MDALQTVLQPVVAMANRQIAASTPARELAMHLEGRSIAMRVRDTGLAVSVSIAAGALGFSDPANVEPDAILTGSLLALGRLGGEAGEQLIRDGQVELNGDAVVADEFRRLLRYARPDLEERLSGVVGDVAAHGIGDVVRNLGRWGRNARQTVEQNIGEYLQEESRSVPSRYEVDEFRQRVHGLRDDVARAEAKLAELEAGRAGRD